MDLLEHLLLEFSLRKRQIAQIVLKFLEIETQLFSRNRRLNSPIQVSIEIFPLVQGYFMEQSLVLYLVSESSYIGNAKK